MNDVKVAIIIVLFLLCVATAMFEMFVASGVWVTFAVGCFAVIVALMIAWDGIIRREA